MTTTRTPPPTCPVRPWPAEQVDTALDDIAERRAQLMARPATPWRAAQLAALAESEATWWETVSEHARTRAHWRAALAAREHALHTARHWRHHASTPVARAAEGENA